MAVAGAAEIDESGDARCADGDVGETQAPGATEGVADDDGKALVSMFAQGRGKAASGTIWIFGEECDGIAARDVRMVDASIGADKTMMRFNNQNTVRTDDTAGFAEDDFDKARIVRELFRQGNCLSRRANTRETPDAAFCFGNDFLSDNQDISVCEGDFRAASGENDELGQVVAFADFGETRNDKNRDRRFGGRCSFGGGRTWSFDGHTRERESYARWADNFTSGRKLGGAKRAGGAHAGWRATRPEIGAEKEDYLLFFEGLSSLGGFAGF